MEKINCFMVLFPVEETIESWIIVNVKRQLNNGDNRNA